MASTTAITNSSNNVRKSSRHVRTESLSFDDLIFDNLLPDTVEVHADAVESVKQKFQETGRTKDVPFKVATANLSTRQNLTHPLRCISMLPKSQQATKRPSSIFRIPRESTIQILASGRGRLETIDSVSNVTSGSITPLSPFSSVGHHVPPKHRMRASQEKEMMHRLLEVSLSKEEKEEDNDDDPSDADYMGDASSCTYNDSVSGLTTDMPTADDHSTEKKYLQKYLTGLKEERELLKTIWKKEFEEELQRNPRPASSETPSITMYAMTIMAQPRPERMSELADSQEMKEWWHEAHPRWPEFKKKAFSPAHFAFVFPLLSHTNAVQAYRSGVIAYSNIGAGSSYKIVLWNYWFACLLVGTVLNLVFTCKYVRRLPEWTKVNQTPDPLEEEPPEPEHTEVHSLWWSQDTNHECLKQSFVNPALLQANEAGALIR
ncbi:MAG: hypothetical protein SGILL_002735, partial [Bacillariaceae sp.]